MTEEQLKKLEQAFFNDASPEEAAAFAKVKFTELTDKIATDPEWYQEMLSLPHARYAQAKVNLGEKILEGDAEMSQWLLERRLPKEFGKRDKVEHEGKLEWNVSVAPFIASPEKRQAIDVQAEPGRIEEKPSA